MPGAYPRARNDKKQGNEKLKLRKEERKRKKRKEKRTVITPDSPPKSEA
jgi:hypothetical protein